MSLALRATLGSKDRWAIQESEGCRARRDLEERRVSQGSVPAPTEATPSSLACRVLRDFGWAAHGSRARRVLRVFLDRQGPLECLGCRECLGTTVCQDSLGSPRNWGRSPSSSTSSRASVGTASRARRPALCPCWRKERRETRASPVCQDWTTAPGASWSGSGPELRRPGETTARENPVVLGALACLGLRDCQAREEKRVHPA